MDYDEKLVKIKRHLFHHPKTLIGISVQVASEMEKKDAYVRILFSLGVATNH